MDAVGGCLAAPSWLAVVVSAQAHSLISGFVVEPATHQSFNLYLNPHLYTSTERERRQFCPTWLQALGLCVCDVCGRGEGGGGRGVHLYLILIIQPPSR